MYKPLLNCQPLETKGNVTKYLCIEENNKMKREIGNKYCTFKSRKERKSCCLCNIDKVRSDDVRIGSPYFYTDRYYKY
jgi:hypothetical protein